MAWTKEKTTFGVAAAVILAAGAASTLAFKTKPPEAGAGRVQPSKQMNPTRDSIAPALRRYAKEHHGELPDSLSDLQSYLPPNSGIDGEHWDWLASGKLLYQLTHKNAILFQQKNAPSGQMKLACCTDGHFEYRKQRGK